MNTSNKIFLVFFLGYSLILTLGLTFDWHYIWNHTGFNFTSHSYPFGDIRNVTNYNSFSELGLEPRSDYFTNNEGQMIPPFNYPSFWLLFSNLNIDNKDTIYFGISFFILFSIGVSLFLKARTKTDVAVYISLLFSPVVALLIERGNNDQVAFFLVSIFCHFNKSRTIQLLTYYLAFTIKFFPSIIIFSLTEKIDLKIIRTGLFILSPILFYIFITFPEVIELGKATPISSPTIGYGWKTYSSILSTYFSQYLLFIFSIASILFIFIYFVLIQPKKTEKTLSNKELMMFKSGILIYLATYIVGTSFDYRLVFLLFTIPTLLKLNSKTSVTSIVLIIFLFWGHQFVLIPLALNKYHISFKMLGEIMLVTKVLSHYVLTLLLIYNYRSVSTNTLFTYTLRNKV